MNKRPVLPALMLEALALLIVNTMLAGGNGVKEFTLFTIIFASAALVLMLICVKVGGRIVKLFWLSAFFIFSFLVFVNYGFREQRQLYNLYSVCEYNDKSVDGTVVRTENKSDGEYIYLRDCECDGKAIGGVVVMYDRSSGLYAGCRVRASGKLEKVPAPANPGQFDSESKYASEQIFGRMTDAQISVSSAGNSLSYYLSRIKGYISSAIYRTTGYAPIFTAMLLGDKGELDSEVRDLYQAGGISHILAISGLHVSFLGMLVYKLLRKIGMNIGVSAALSSAFVILYTMMTGASVSTVRACIMLCLIMGATALGRTYDIITAIAISMGIILLIYPRQLSQAGFQLSYMAVLAFGMMMPELTAVLKLTIRRKGKGKISALRYHAGKGYEGLLGSITVSFFTWPVIAWHMYVLPPVSVLLNLVVIPIMSILMLVMVAGTVAAVICIETGIPMVVCTIFWKPGEIILDIYRYLCEKTLDMRYGRVVTGRPEVYKILIYTTIILIINILLHILVIYIKRQKRLCELRGEKWQNEKRILKRLVRYGVLPVFATMLMITPVILHRGREKSKLLVLDVGQGDGILYLSDELCIAVDGGSRFITGIGSYRIEPALEYYGYDHVNAWFLTHPDMDHTSGLIDILEDKTSTIIVDRIYIPEASYGDSWGKVLAFSDSFETKLTGRGDTATWGAGGLRVIYPDRYDYAEDDNSLCTVIMLELEHVKILLTGDISEDVEKLILERNSSESLQADILKIAHHGSRFSTCEELLDVVKPQSAIISVGKNNYGHPSGQVLERLEDRNIDIHITEKAGCVIIDDTENGYFISEFCAEE